MPFRRQTYFFCAAVVVLLLACGGDRESNPFPSPTAPPPTAGGTGAHTNLQGPNRVVRTSDQRRQLSSDDARGIRVVQRS